LGDQVISFKNVSKAYGDRLLIDKLTLDIPAGSIVGVIGANGAGKTTFLKLITGEEKPDDGEVAIGSTVKLTYLDQSRETLNPENSVWQEISGGADTLDLGSHKKNSRAYVSAFNFMGADQQKKVGTLSGGERNRVHLAKMLKEEGNVLMLDEPTNDLDVNTLRALEEAIENYAGCAVVVSHDRWFLDRIATHIIAFEGESEVWWQVGNWSDYEEEFRKRKGVEALTPHRIKYRSLKR
jgi:ATPase subunit of ABC transporter with duplicated ATPase domains